MEDLTSLKKKIDWLTKKAKKTFESKPKLEHEIVFEWCILSTSCMINAMKPRH